jgi:hypothetical protein
VLELEELEPAMPAGGERMALRIGGHTSYCREEAWPRTAIASRSRKNLG